jgi:DNA-binding MarR family transcriptional regulator
MQQDSDDVAAAADRLLVASRALVAVAARSVADAGDITLPQFRALVVLARLESATVGQLADLLDIHPSTATRLCDRLVRKRLVRRRAGMAADRRQTTVVLTAPGRRLMEGVTRRRHRDLAAIASRMGPEARVRAVEGLEAFAAAAGEAPGLDPFGWAIGPDAAGRDDARVG